MVVAVELMYITITAAKFSMIMDHPICFKFWGYDKL